MDETTIWWILSIDYRKQLTWIKIMFVHEDFFLADCGLYNKKNHVLNYEIEDEKTQQE